MSSKILIFLVMQTFLLTGCVILGEKIPNTSPEYRALIKSSSVGAINEVFKIKRSYIQAVKLLEKQADRCLHFIYTTKTELKGPALFKYGTERKTRYRSNMERSKNMTSLVTRYGSVENGKITDEEIVSVVDLKPVSKRVTRVTVYGGKHFAPQVNKAIKHWLKGTNMGCPK